MSSPICYVFQCLHIFVFLKWSYQCNQSQVATQTREYSIMVCCMQKRNKFLESYIQNEFYVSEIIDAHKFDIFLWTSKPRHSTIAPVTSFFLFCRKHFPEIIPLHRLKWKSHFVVHIRLLFNTRRKLASNQFWMYCLAHNFWFHCCILKVTIVIKFLPNIRLC